MKKTNILLILLLCFTLTSCNGNNNEDQLCANELYEIQEYDKDQLYISDVAVYSEYSDYTSDSIDYDKVMDFSYELLEYMYSGACAQGQYDVVYPSTPVLDVQILINDSEKGIGVHIVKYTDRFLSKTKYYFGLVTSDVDGERVSLRYDEAFNDEIYDLLHE